MAATAFCCSSCVEGATGNGYDLAKGGGCDAAASFRCATGTGSDNDMSEGRCVADPAASLHCSTGAHYSIWNRNVTMSKFHKVNSYLGYEQFLRG